MKKIFLVSLMLISPVYGFSQQTIIGPQIPLQIDSVRELGLIQSERLGVEAHFREDESACYRRFVVANCIQKLRVQRRIVLDELRRRELLINDADRKRKAMEQIEHINEKSSPQRMDEEASKRQQAREAQQEREKQAFQKQKVDPVSGGRTEKPVAPSRSVEDISIKRQQYDDKLKEAQAHRLSQEKTNSEKSKGSFKPLPAPP